jgi:hypothetical protein
VQVLLFVTVTDMSAVLRDYCKTRQKFSARNMFTRDGAGIAGGEYFGIFYGYIYDTNFNRRGYVPVARQTTE